jgi:hypothetical protein
MVGARLYVVEMVSDWPVDVQHGTLYLPDTTQDNFV